MIATKERTITKRRLVRIKEKFSLRVRDGSNSDMRIPIPKLAAVQFDAAIEENPMCSLRISGIHPPKPCDKKNTLTPKRNMILISFEMTIDFQIRNVLFPSVLRT